MSKTNISLTVILLRFRILYNSKLTFGNKCCLCAGSTAHILLRVFKISIYYGEMINSTWHERDGESLVWLTRIAIFLVQYTRLLRQQVAANPWQKEEEERDTNQHTHPPRPTSTPPPPQKKKKKKKKKKNRTKSTHRDQLPLPKAKYSQC